MFLFKEHFFCNNFCMSENLQTRATRTRKQTTKSENVTAELDDISKIRKIVFDETSTQNRPLCDIVYANLIVITAVFLSAFIPILSFALPALVLIYFEVGLFGYVAAKENGDAAKLEDIFISLKKYIRIFCVFVIKTLMIAFWTCLFIVPGVICFLNYCFSANILYESDDLDAKGVLLLSKELVKGKRYTIFFYMLLALVAICVAASSMFLIILLFDAFLFVPQIYYVIFICLAGLITLLLVSLPMVQIAIADCYLAAKQEIIGRK